MSVVTLAQLNGVAKDVYGDSLENLIPDSELLMKMIPFATTAKLGDEFVQPVVTSDEQGATYAGSDDDAFALEDPEAMTTRPASVKGSQILMRSQIGYKAAASAVGAGKAAFVNATELVIKRLMASLSKRIEISHLYGQDGLMQIASSANQSATETRVLASVGHFAPRIWIGAKGAKLEAWNVNTQVGTGAFTVVRTDITNRYLYVSGVAGDITALDAAILANPDVIKLFYKGAKSGATLKESLGLNGIITKSGTLFNIDNTLYDLYKGNTFSAGSASLTFEKVNKAMMILNNFGVEGDVDMLINPNTWKDLLDNVAALREFDYSYDPKKAEQGHKEIMFHTLNSRIRIHANGLVKDGDAFIIKKDVLKRVGAWEASVKTPGYGGDLFRQLDNNAGFEIQAYTDQALFSVHPSWLLKITDIVNS